MKKLPSKYRMDVVDGKLVFSAPSSKVQKPASVAAVEIAPSASLKQKVSNQECKQCKKSFSPRPSRGAPQIYCTVKCRTKYNNDKNAQRYKVECKVDSPERGRVCPQCSTKLEEYSGRGQPKKFCTSKCCQERFKTKYKQERAVKSSTLVPSCRQCSEDFVKQKGNQKYCSAKCREEYYGNLNKKVPSEPVEKLHGVSYTQKSGGDKECLSCTKGFKQKKETQLYCSSKCQKREEKRRWQQKRRTVLPGSKITGAFVAKVEEALATLPPEEKLPPIPEDTSAVSLLAAGRTLTASGLVEAVQNTYGIDVAEERPRPKAFWFSVLLARHSRTLEDWKKLLGKHGLVSNPKIEKWLLFRAGSSSPAAAGRLKAQLGI